MSDDNLKSKLNEILNQDPQSIKAHVASEALNYDDPKLFFQDLLSHGCVSGMVGSLIYYRQTHKFFNTHYDEIETIRSELEEITGEQLSIKGDLMNDLAWTAFEHTAFQLSSELEVL